VKVCLRLRPTSLLLSAVCCCRLCLSSPGLMPLLFSSVYSPTHLLQLQSLLLLFRVQVGRCLSPTLQWSVPHFSHCCRPSPLQAHWGRWHHTHLLWSACLFTVRVWSALPQSPELRAPCPLCYVSFFFQLLVYYSIWFSLFFFPGWGSVCPGGYGDLAHGCLW
jgi:hypothetical protein